MIALLSTLLGFVSSGIPEIFKYFKAKQDRAHELAVMKLQMEAQAAGHAQRLEEINTEADIREVEAIQQAAKPVLSGVKWVDAVVVLATSLVRPMVTYHFFALYSVVKWAQFGILKAQTGLAWKEALPMVWTDQDTAIFGAIIGFWFGGRQLARAAKKG